jgi:hypothetical protein
MADIPENWGTGGTPLSPTGVDSQPTLAAAMRDVADDLADFGSAQADGSGVIEGLFVTDPTTGSSQLTGVGNTTWNADVRAGLCEVNAVFKEFAAQADFSIHSGSHVDAGFIVGASIMAAIVCKNVAGTVTMVAVKGAAATTGSQVAPTDAEIQAAVGASNGWCKVAECTLNRTGDTTVTESQDWTLRNISTGRGGQALRTTKA